MSVCDQQIDGRKSNPEIMSPWFIYGIIYLLRPGQKLAMIYCMYVMSTPKRRVWRSIWGGSDRSLPQNYVGRWEIYLNKLGRREMVLNRELWEMAHIKLRDGKWVPPYRPFTKQFRLWLHSNIKNMNMTSSSRGRTVAVVSRNPKIVSSIPASGPWWRTHTKDLNIGKKSRWSMFPNNTSGKIRIRQQKKLRGYGDYMCTHTVQYVIK
jgi:hypothetical protein